MKEFIGKKVKLIKTSGAVYLGTLYERKDSVILSNFSIVNKHGGETVSKHDRSRMIAKNKIQSIEVI